MHRLVLNNTRLRQTLMSLAVLMSSIKDIYYNWNLQLSFFIVVFQSPFGMVDRVVQTDLMA